MRVKQHSHTEIYDRKERGAELTDLQKGLAQGSTRHAREKKADDVWHQSQIFTISSRPSDLLGRHYILQGEDSSQLCRWICYSQWT